MRAIVVRHYGGPEALDVIEAALPEPGRGQVRIRVEAAAVNPVDLAAPGAGRGRVRNQRRPGPLDVFTGRRSVR